MSLNSSVENMKKIYCVALTERLGCNQRLIPEVKEDMEDAGQRIRNSLDMAGIEKTVIYHSSELPAEQSAKVILDELNRPLAHPRASRPITARTELNDYLYWDLWAVSKVVDIAETPCVIIAHPEDFRVSMAPYCDVPYAFMPIGVRMGTVQKVDIDPVNKKVSYFGGLFRNF